MRRSVEDRGHQHWHGGSQQYDPPSYGPAHGGSSRWDTTSGGSGHAPSHGRDSRAYDPYSGASSHDWATHAHPGEGQGYRGEGGSRAGHAGGSYAHPGAHYGGRHTSGDRFDDCHLHGSSRGPPADDAGGSDRGATVPFSRSVSVGSYGGGYGYGDRPTAYEIPRGSAAPPTSSTRGHRETAPPPAFGGPYNPYAQAPPYTCTHEPVPPPTFGDPFYATYGQGDLPSARGYHYSSDSD
jgi:hypothetical protein